METSRRENETKIELGRLIDRPDHTLIAEAVGLTNSDQETHSSTKFRDIWDF